MRLQSAYAHIIGYFSVFPKTSSEIKSSKNRMLWWHKCRRLLKSNNTLGCNILLSHQEAKHIRGAVNASIRFVQFANKWPQINLAVTESQKIVTTENR